MCFKLQEPLVIWDLTEDMPELTYRKLNVVSGAHNVALYDYMSNVANDEVDEEVEIFHISEDGPINSEDLVDEVPAKLIGDVDFDPANVVQHEAQPAPEKIQEEPQPGGTAIRI